MTEPRQIDDPQPGHWLIRETSGGARVPARIWIERLPEHEGLPIDPWPNAETRILGIFAEVAGEEAAVERVWTTRGEPIDAQRYAFEVADVKWLRENRPNDPRANPRKKVRLRDVELPF